MMIRRENGFTIVELMITMVIFVLAIAAAAQIFAGLLTQFKQQTKIAESNIESVIGLELMRSDIEQAGFGLPWSLGPNTVTNNQIVSYTEAIDDPFTAWDDRKYNDNNNPPTAIMADDPTGTLNNSDILVIKATNVATNTASSRWTYIYAGAGVPKTWGSAQEDLQDSDLVTVMTPQRQLSNGNGTGGSYARPGTNGTVSGLTFANVKADGNYKPFVAGTNLIYGIAPGGAGQYITMPFNRADYYIRRPAAIPARCEPTTGVLYKGTIIHSSGDHLELPLLDCVLDMKVVIYSDEQRPAAQAAPVPHVTVAPPLNVPIPQPLHLPSYPDIASAIRDQVKEVRVYIVAQEGQMDTSYTYTNPNPNACAGYTGSVPISNLVCISDIDYAGNALLVAAVPVPNVHYRWKLYTLVTTTYNLQ